MGYTFKIEVECFMFDENGYHWNLLCRKDEPLSAPWQICAIGYADTIQEAFNQAYATREKFKNIKE